MQKLSSISAKRWLFSLVMALASALSITSSHSVRISLSSHYNIHFFLVLFLTGLYAVAFQRFERRRFAFAAAGGFVFGLCQSCGLVFTAGTFASYIPAAIPGYAIFYTAVLYLLFALLEKGEHVAPARPKGRAAQTVERLLAGGRKSFWALFCILALCWLPYYILYFPGLVTPDTMVQMHEGLAVTTLTSHHPIVHTLFLGGCMRIGQFLFGNFAAGVALASAAQLLGCAFVVALSLCQMERLSIRLGYRAACLGFYALFPVFGWYGVTMWKDVWVACFVLAFLVCVLNILRQKELFFRSAKRVAFFCVAVLGLITSKNTGIYLFAGTVLVMLIALRGLRRQMAATLLAGLAFYMLFTGPVYSALGVEKGDMREMLSTPLIMLARVVHLGGEISPEDQELIDTVLPYDELAERYSYQSADGVKNVFDTDTFLRQPARYIAMWARVGLQNPGSYLRGFLEQCMGYWYPDIGAGDFAHSTYPYYIRTFGINFGGQETMMGRYAEPGEDAIRAVEAYGPYLRQIPGLSMLYSVGFHYWLLLAAGLYLLFRRRGLLLVPLCLPFIVWLTCVASPSHASLRYSYPTLLCLPLLLGVFWAKKPTAGQTPEGSAPDT